MSASEFDPYSSLVRHDRQIMHVPQAVATDFDCTLADTKDTFGYTVQVARGFGIDEARLFAVKQKTEDRGESFSAFQHIAETYGRDISILVANAVGATGGQVKYYGDVPRFVQRLNGGAMPRFIMSSTEHKVGQIGKIQSTMYEGGYMLTPNSDKGRFKRTLFHEDDRFTNECGRNGHYRAVSTYAPWLEYYIDELFLVDDNPAVAEGWGEPGAWLSERGKELKGQLPKNIITVASLDWLTPSEGRMTRGDKEEIMRQPIADCAFEGLLEIKPVLNLDNPDSRLVFVGDM